MNLGAESAARLGSAAQTERLAQSDLLGAVSPSAGRWPPGNTQGTVREHAPGLDGDQHAGGDQGTGEQTELLG